MVTSSSSSTLEMLPDEMLLEVCKYLLCIDILQSFFGLNERMTRLIRDYRYHVSLHKASFGQCAHVYTNVFHKIGSHIRTLVIDRLYSVLQSDMFYRHFSHQNLSSIFPKLEITIVAFRHGTLLSFVNMLEGFEYLVELNIRSLFSIPTEHQPAVAEALLKANNQKIRSVLISNGSSCLRLNNSSNVIYSNIINLEITMESLDDFLGLFSAIPNVRQLNVTLTGSDVFAPITDETPHLVHLTNFQFVSVACPWNAEDLVTLLHRMAGVQYLSLQLFTYDIRLIDGQQILVLQQSLTHLQQFDYSVIYIGEPNSLDREEIFASWAPCSIECLVDKTSNMNYIFVFIYTLFPCNEPFRSLALPAAIISKTITVKNGDRHVKELNIHTVSNFVDCWPIIARWHRVKELNIWFSNTNSAPIAVTEEQQQQPQQTKLVPKMDRLKHLRLGASVPSDLDHLSFILSAASNLIRLDLNFDSLLSLLDSEEASRLLQQRITALSINKVSPSSSVGIDDHHISRIASTFPRLRHMFVDLTHVLPTIDSMILCILSEFKKRLVSLGADGPSSDEMKADARKWLEENNYKNNMNIVHPTEFDAYFNVQSSRLLVWM